jgi:carbonic anhydrase
MLKTIDYSKSGANWLGQCKSGGKQSPINIEKVLKIDKHIRDLQYSKKEIGKVEFNGSYYRINVNKQSCKIIYTNRKNKKIKYTLKRVVFRTPAEHQIEGDKFDMEIQLVHETEEKVPNKILIISILALKTKDKKKADNFVESIDFLGKKNVDVSGFQSMISQQGDYFVYNGSQTVPNCVENVLWVVIKRPIKISSHTINSSKRLFCESCMPHGNARVLQKSSNREIFQYRFK